MNEDSIIYNELPLTEAFIPTRLLHREGQLKELERCLKPALCNKTIENIFIIGPSGTGKTTLAKWILESYFKEISCYINCWKYRSTYEVLKEILLNFQVSVHGRESTGELVNRLEKLIKKKRMASGKLYREYCKLVKNPVVDRTYRSYMKRMVELDLVKVGGFGRWRSYEFII